MHDQAYVSVHAPSRPRGQHGFTMLELLVVVAILGVLVTIALPMYRGYVNRAKITVAVGALDAVRKSIEAFHVDHGDYPSPPINFATGLDDNGHTAIEPMLANQISEDLFSIVYAFDGKDYTVTARANDDKHTLMTLTQQGITY